MLWLRRKHWQFERWREQRKWRPGMAYLDHGWTPCILIKVESWDDLHGVSLVDGSYKQGCDIFHCGPEPVSLKEARAIAAVLKKMAR